jgi:hypothetical protein
MQKSAWIVTIAMFIAVPAAAQTGFPDLRGTWKGDSESIVADAGNAHHPGAANSGTRLDSVTFTMKIDQQDGRREQPNRSSASYHGRAQFISSILTVTPLGHCLGQTD